MDALREAQAQLEKMSGYASRPGAWDGIDDDVRQAQENARTYAAVASAEALTRIAEEAGLMRDWLTNMAEETRTRADMGAQCDEAFAQLERVREALGAVVGSDLASVAGMFRKRCEALEMGESDYERGYLCGLKSSDAYQQGLARGREQQAAELAAWQDAPRWQPVENMPAYGADDSVSVENGRLEVWPASQGAAPYRVALPPGYALCRLMEPGTEANDA